MGLRLLTVALALAIIHPLLAESPSSTPVQIEHAWIRWLPAGVPAGGYATLVNTSDHAVVLTSASSPAFTSIELHRTVNLDGTMSMEPAGHIVVPAHGTVDFATQGLHLMLMQPVNPLKAGDRVPITLHFEGGATATALFEVRAHE